MSSSSSSSAAGPKGRKLVAEMPVFLSQAIRDKQKAPQRKIDEFWKKFTTQAPGKGKWPSQPGLRAEHGALTDAEPIATTLLPKNEYAEKLARRTAAKESGSGTAAQASFEEAAALCKAKVDKI